jgi:hypothetical protein
VPASESVLPLALAREFRARPFGRHSEALQTLLGRMRGEPTPGKPFLLLKRANAEWRLAFMSAEPPLRPVLSDIVFTRLEDAEWHVFRLRWARMTGVELPHDLAPSEA